MTQENNIHEVSVWTVRPGISMQISAENSDLRRIEFYLDSDHQEILRVAAFSKGNWPMYEQPTLQEIIFFAQNTKSQLPDSEMTSALISHTRKLISQEIEKLIEINANILG